MKTVGHGAGGGSLGWWFTGVGARARVRRGFILGVDAKSASLRIDWRPRPDPGEPAHFVFHYDDSTGRAVGWHREPNPHVDRLEHRQVRDSPDEDEPAYVDSLSPVELVWDVLGRIDAWV